MDSPEREREKEMRERERVREWEREKDDPSDPGIKLFGHVIALPSTEEGDKEGYGKEGTVAMSAVSEGKGWGEGGVDREEREVKMSKDGGGGRKQREGESDDDDEEMRGENTPPQSEEKRRAPARALSCGLVRPNAPCRPTFVSRVLKTPAPFTAALFLNAAPLSVKEMTTMTAMGEARLTGAMGCSYCAVQDAIVAAALPIDDDGGADELGSSSGSNSGSGSDDGGKGEREGEGEGEGGGDNEGAPTPENRLRSVGAEERAMEGGCQGSSEGTEEDSEPLARRDSNVQQAVVDAAWEEDEREREMERAREGGRVHSEGQERAQQKGRQGSQQPPGGLKKPDKIVPCPRCDSLDTKFCYYNNYNVNQPRHFCKKCQRYWTAGGTLRNVPVGSGRRKNKNSQGISAVGREKVEVAQLRSPSPGVLGMGAALPREGGRGGNHFSSRITPGGSVGMVGALDSIAYSDSALSGLTTLRREGLSNEGPMSPCGAGQQLKAQQEGCGEAVDVDLRLRSTANSGGAGGGGLRRLPSTVGGGRAEGEGGSMSALLREDTVVGREGLTPPAPIIGSSVALSDAPMPPWAGMPFHSGVGREGGWPGTASFGYFGNGMWPYGYVMGWGAQAPPSATAPPTAGSPWGSPGTWPAPAWSPLAGSPWGAAAPWLNPWHGAAHAQAFGPTTPGKRGREEGEGEGEAQEHALPQGVVKTMRIEDPGEDRGRSSVWTRVGLGGSSPSEALLRTAAKEGSQCVDHHHINPAARARSMVFHEM